MFVSNQCQIGCNRCPKHAKASSCICLPWTHPCACLRFLTHRYLWTRAWFTAYTLRVVTAPPNTRVQNVCRISGLGSKLKYRIHINCMDMFIYVFIYVLKSWGGGGGGEGESTFFINIYFLIWKSQGGGGGQGRYGPGERERDIIFIIIYWKHWKRKIKKWISKRNTRARNFFVINSNSWMIDNDKQTNNDAQSLISFNSSTHKTQVGSQ